MNNETTQQMIDFHKTQIENHQEEIKKLTEKGNSAKPEPMFGQALRVEDAEYWLEYKGQIYNTGFCNDDMLCHGNYFVSEEAAELEAEKRRLRQIARVRMAESWGEEIVDWANRSQYKYSLVIPYGTYNQDTFSTIHFKTQKDAQSFLDEVGEEGIRKILEL